MKNRFFVKWLALMLAVLMMFGTTVYADEEAYDPFIEEEDTVLIADTADTTEEDAAYVEAEEPTYSEEAQDPEEAMVQEAVEDPMDAEADGDLEPAVNMPGLAGAEVSEDILDMDEVVGYDMYTLKLSTSQSFSCSDQEDYQYFAYTAAASGTYRFEVTGTKGRMMFGMLDDSAEYYYDWNGVYSNNDIKVTAQLTKGKKYYFVIYPNSKRSDSGKCILKRTTKEIQSASIYYIDTNKFLKVGPTGNGKWATKDDGSKNFDVWLFGIDEMLSLFKMDITFTDGTKTTWKGTDGPEIGSTGLLVVPEQITDNWKLDQKAYCYLYMGDMMSDKKLEIKYKDPLFKDVRDPSNPYYKAIYWAADKGITKGYSDGTFGINKACTRSEAVMFIWRLAGKPAPKSASKSPFSDVPTSHAHYKAILWAAQKGITTGYSDGKFRPSQTCTRGQIMTFIWRYKGKPAPKTVSKSPFKDVPKTHTYYKAILWGSQKGITKGFDDGTFGINKDCTRGQIVTFLYRI
jgi:hypothetical protein